MKTGKRTMHNVAYKARELGESGKETDEIVASKVKAFAGAKGS